ncbi:tripartite motif-containing protein 16 isoform X1 [Amia ocellicauda]|uniref:tripartite motif-containing protein 16 isoform X1 n=1 Tax=Amia ocellicauda TaxID=2972642 RepID=UPI003463DB07
MPELRKAGSKKEAAAAPTAPPYDPNAPEPKTRAELLQYSCSLSLDDKTAQKFLWLSDQSKKVTRRTEDTCPYLDRPERFSHCPQVLCQEVLSGGRYYWEVQWTGWVVVGVAFLSLSRKGENGTCGLGENTKSWGLGWAGSSYHAWHNGELTDVTGVPRASQLGVYLDQPAGLLAFYCLKGGVEEGEAGEEAEVGVEREAVLLHKFKASFTEPLLPGFWVGSNSSCTLLRSE